MSTPRRICWNCRHAGEHHYYGVDRRGFVHCEHPDRAVRGEPEDPDEQTVWDTFREFYNTCPAFDWKPELAPEREKQ
jgi:hypothetical protein